MNPLRTLPALPESKCAPVRTKIMEFLPKELASLSTAYLASYEPGEQVLRSRQRFELFTLFMRRDLFFICPRDAKEPLLLARVTRVAERELTFLFDNSPSGLPGAGSFSVQALDDWHKVTTSVDWALESVDLFEAVLEKPLGDAMGLFA